MAALAAVIGAAATLSGCGGAFRSLPSGRVVDVTERDFHITVAESRLTPGPVIFRAKNKGPDAHELIVVRDDNGSLKLRTDGMTVDEDGLEKSIVGTLEPGAAGAVRDLRVELRPGRYVLLCNMYGHFMGGMHSTVVVR